MTTSRQRLLGPLVLMRHRSIAATVLVLLLLAQVVSAVHFILIPHTFDVRTQRVVGCPLAHEEQGNHRHGSQPCSDEKERDRSPAPTEECQVYAHLHQSQIPNTPAPTIQPPTVALTSIVLQFDTIPSASRRLYMLAPSHSPPIIAIS